MRPLNRIPAVSPQAPSQNPPLLFGLLSVSYGFTTAVGGLLIPYLLRKYGVPVNRIAGVVAIALIPLVWSFLWSPLADVGLRRRSWVLLSALGAAVTGSLAILGIHASLVVLTLLLFLSRALIGLQSAATGALMCALPPTSRGRAAGWSQAGNIGAGAVGGGLVIWLADHASLTVVAIAIAAGTMVPSLAALLIEESAPAARGTGTFFGDLVNDLGEIVRCGRTWLGILFFVSPAGSFAIGNLISGLGPDYRASGTQVVWITGLGGGLLTAAGSFIGGYLADHVNRMAAYSLAAVCGALFAAYLAFAPATPVTFGAGFSAYSIASGFSYCMFTALVLDVVGQRRHAAATMYSVLNASGNVAIAYMVWLDGLGYKHWGVRGLMSTDALANGVSAAVLLVVAVVTRQYWRRGTATAGSVPVA